jgi:hypothetical protein
MGLCSHRHKTDKAKRKCQLRAARKLKRINRHDCGNGYSGVIICKKGLVFCGTCGKEFDGK